jgi:hypothetical protein
VNVAYVPSPEAIETVGVSANSFDAEQGAAGGAAINVIIKSGTNNLHGVVFERNTNNAFDAINNYFSHPGHQLSPYVTADLNMIEPFGDMTYNGLQATLKKRIGSSIIGASYAFSRSIDNINGDNDDGSLWRAYPMSFALDKQLSGINRQQTLNIYWVYNLPSTPAARAPAPPRSIRP